MVWCLCINDYKHTKIVYIKKWHYFNVYLVFISSKNLASIKGGFLFGTSSGKLI
jgi:hypothetical protein